MNEDEVEGNEGVRSGTHRSLVESRTLGIVQIIDMTEKAALIRAL